MKLGFYRNPIILKIILCKTKLLSTLRERMKEKTFNHGNPFNIDINNHIEFIQKDLENDINEQFWKFIKSKLLEVYMDNQQDLVANIKLIINKTIIKQ